MTVTEEPTGQFSALLTGKPAVARWTVDPSWMLTLTGMLGHRMARLPGVAWAAVLFPTLAVPGLRFPDEVWELYRRVWWDGPVAPSTAAVTARAEYVCAVGSEAEAGIRTEAVMDAGPRACSFTVVRTGCSAAPFGERSLPARPPEPPTDHGFSIVIDNSSVAEYLKFVDLHHPLVDSAMTAHHGGLPNQLVPSGLLLVAALRDHESEQGEIEMWYRHPVPAGASINIGEASGEGCCDGTVTLPTKQEAARFRVSSERGG